MNTAPTSSLLSTSQKRSAAALRPSPTSTVDLTQDDSDSDNDEVIVHEDDDDEEEDEVVVLGVAHHHHHAQGNNDDNDNDEEQETTLPLLYSLDTKVCGHLKIVGIRHYRGVAYTGEFVTLSREPHNPYDRNAIRVDNLRGQKVGHVAKEAAAVLSPVWDRLGDDQLVLDASIPWRGNGYYHPLSLDIRAPHAEWDALKQALAPLVPKYGKKNAVSSKARGNDNVSVSTKKLDWKQQQAQLDQLWKDVLDKQLENLPQVTPPQALQTTMLDHQRQALQWMVHREQASTNNPFFETKTEKGQAVHFCRLTNSSQPTKPAPTRGGILADDMGLGKTMSTIALVLAQPPHGRVYTPGQFAPQNNEAVVVASDDEESGDFVPMPTIQELKEHKVGVLRQVATRLLPGSHHFATAKKPALAKILHEALLAAKITPQMLQQALNAPVTSSQKAPPGGGAASLPLTLIVAPVSVLSNWQDQIDAHVAPHTLRVGLYQGPQRHELLENTNDYDILVTSYHTLQADFRPIHAQRKAAGTAPPAKKKTKTSSIFEMKFFRVVLDEGHMIRNQKTGLFRACAALQAERRWCLSGTPLTNKPEDVASLLSFLRLEPLCDRTVFRRCIAQPLKEGDEQGLANLRLCMAFTALRRSKATIILPDKTVELRSVMAESSENPHYKIYDTIYQAARAAFGAALKSDDNQALSHANIFEILLRLRQSCCSGTLVPKERIVVAEKVLAVVQNKGHELTADEGKELLEKLKGALEADDQDKDRMPECGICFEELNAEKAVVLRGCSHVFCKDCLTKTLDYKTVCAYCRKPYKEDDLIPYQAAEAASALTDAKPKAASLTEGWNSMGPSPKMKALLLSLQEMKPDEKGVVFSQFTTFLDQLECFLTDNGWSFVRIDGSKSRTQRMQAIKDFNAEDGKRLVLCSLQLGQGINLTRGNHVFLMDTWWNKAVEQQAQDRCHRLGQTRACRIVRFVAADSIESRMVDLQEAKAALGKGVFESLSPDEKRKARMSELKKLLEL